MFGRYASTIKSALKQEWGLIRVPQRFESYNVAPATQVPIVRLTDEGRACMMARWGLIPSWADGPVKYSTINARCETLHKAASYRGPWKHGQRCLFPVSGFYEWQATDGGKQPWYIRLPEQDTFALAGLWERNGDMESATIVTLPANELLARIHNTSKRMPLILDPESFDAWLGENSEAAQSVITPYPAAQMEAWPVSRYVNNPRHQGGECIKKMSV